MSNFGCLIYPNNEIIICDEFSHGDEILHKLNIFNYTNINNFDHEKFCYRHNILRIILYNDELTIAIPNKVNKNQLISAYNYCKNEITMSKYYCYDNSTKNLLSFDDNKKLLNYLKREINGKTNSI